jgi:hypothetical protein
LSESDLRKELDNFEKELKKKLENKEIDVEEALDQYMVKRDEIEDKIEEWKRQNGKYRRQVFEEDVKGFSEIESGVVHKVRLDLPKLTNEELLIECSKDLWSVRKEVGGILGGLTRWFAKWGGKSQEAKLQARYFQAMTKLLTVLARQNQIMINLVQEQSRK